VTLDQDHLRSKTTSRADPSFEKDRLWLNGVEEEIKPGGRMATCIDALRGLRREVEKKDGEIKVYMFPLLYLCQTSELDFDPIHFIINLTTLNVEIKK